MAAQSAKASKAVILARGLGTRMREDDGSAATPIAAAQAEAAARGAKAMMPLDVPDAGDTPPSKIPPPNTPSPAGAQPRPETRAPSGAPSGGAAKSETEGIARPARPFLDYVLSALADAGYTDVCLVIAPDHDRVRDYYTHEGAPRRLRVSFAVQDEPRGTADALLAAEAFAADDDLLVINGDNYYPVAAMRALRELDEPGTVLFEPDGLVRRGHIAPERLRAFAIGAVNADGYLADIIEKPDAATMANIGAAGAGLGAGLDVAGDEDASPPGEVGSGDTADRGRRDGAGRPDVSHGPDVRARRGPLVSMNCWRLPPAVFDACRRVQPSPRGELELTQAIRDAVRDGTLRIKVLRSHDGVLDLSRRADIATVAHALRGVMVHP